MRKLIFALALVIGWAVIADSADAGPLRRLLHRRGACASGR